MTVFHDVKLEIVRPGPSHNQLLSPLTPYTALCGESAPVNFSINLEQHQLMDQISRLRYFVRDGQQTHIVDEKTRQAAVNDMGQTVSRILDNLRNLLFEQGRALGQAIQDHDGKNRNEHMIHLRLVSSASELANIPFEIAISPPATPAEGKRMLLDLNLPIVLTREIRRTRPMPIAWDRELKTKILIIAAQPGLLTVPLKNHIRAIRKSFEPWVGWPQVKPEEDPGTEPDSSSRVKNARERIRILKDASIKSIYEICSQKRFTHVHILAHGGAFEDSGEQRFGLVLCDPDDKNKPHLVSGEKLVKALQAEHQDGTTRSSPVMVTLATCDSGAQGSILVPGGSLAYDLHVAGIPWVIASQFPLSKKGSTFLAREFYPRIWRGDDPREALFEIRRYLFAHVDKMHDWASLVIYASLPKDFDSQVVKNFETQTKEAIETAMKHADDVSSAVEFRGATMTTRELRDKIEPILNKVEEYLKFWKKRLPSDRDMNSRLSRAEFYGISGSVYKRIALLYKSRDKNEINTSDPKVYFKNIRKALACYNQAIEEWATDETKYHWVATQYLSLKAVLDWSSQGSPKEVKDRYKPDDRDFSRYEMAKQLALKDLRKADSDIEKAWACGTLAELEMLSIHYTRTVSRKYTTIQNIVKEYCAGLIEYVGIDNFAAKSTLRQFMRYKLYWGDAEDGRLGKIAKEAVNALTLDE